MQKAQHQSSQTPQSTQKVKTLKIRFNLPLHPRQIYQFRGAVADAAGWENNLFHNHGYVPEVGNLTDNIMQQEAANQPVKHLEDKPKKERNGSSKEANNTPSAVFYRYPLIQYRCERGKAAIWAMGEGINAINKWMNNGLDNFHIGGKKRALQITDFKGEDFYLGYSEKMHTYRLMDWLAFNQANYQRWLHLDRLTKRITLLEEVLAGQLLAFATAAQWQIPKHFDVHLFSIRNTRPITIHGSQKIAFNLLYKTNLALPPALAVGRSTAFGFGVQHPCLVD